MAFQQAIFTYHSIRSLHPESPGCLPSPSSSLEVRADGAVIYRSSDHKVQDFQIPKGSSCCFHSREIDEAKYTDFGLAEVGEFPFPARIARGTLFTSQTTVVYRVTGQGMQVVAGSEKGNVDGDQRTAKFSNITELVVSDTNVFVLDNGLVRKVTPDGDVSTLQLKQNDVDVTLTSPKSLQIDHLSNLFLIDQGKLFKIDTPSGTVTHFTDLASCKRVSVPYTGSLIVLLDCGSLEFISCDGKTQGDFFHPNALPTIFNMIMTKDGGLLCLGEKGFSLIPASMLTFLSIPHNPTTPPCLLTDLTNLLDDSTFSDAVFIVDGHRINAHRAILGGRCKYFATMFASGFLEGGKDKDIKIEDTTPEAFRAVLKYLYTDSLEVDELIKFDVLRLSHMYEIDRLYKHCLPLLTNSNCVKWLLLANAHGFEDIEAGAIKLAQKNLQVLRDCSKEDWKMLCENQELLNKAMGRSGQN